MLLPFPSTARGNAAASVGDSTDAMMRRPAAPVSTAMLSMVWQFVVLPGAQTVTDVYKVLTLAVGPGPALTTIGATLLAAVASVLVLAALLDAPALLCPLQAASD